MLAAAIEASKWGLQKSIPNQ